MHAKLYLAETASICSAIDYDLIDRIAARLAYLKGKLYIVGLGGSMANAIHMAADLRKLCEVNAEAFDNIAEITARMNDEGPETIFGSWLSRITPDDALFVLSVGGGAPHVSQALIYSVDQAQAAGAAVFGVVGPNGGYTAKHGDLVIKVPVENPKHVTPHTEAFQMVVVHCLVSHPLLQKNACKW